MTPVAAGTFAQSASRDAHGLSLLAPVHAEMRSAASAPGPMISADSHAQLPPATADSVTLNTAGIKARDAHSLALSAPATLSAPDSDVRPPTADRLWACCACGNYTDDVRQCYVGARGD